MENKTGSIADSWGLQSIKSLKATVHLTFIYFMYSNAMCNC